MSDRLLLMDIGNSRGKWLLLEGDKELRRGAGAVDELVDALADDLFGARALVASVAGEDRNAALSERLTAVGCTVWIARAVAALGGLVNSYADPHRMGVDRWLAMLAAFQRAGGRVCVVDAGSALTIDLVSDAGEHEGGFIIPGTDLMQRALFSDTERVRFDVPATPVLAPGRSTAEAVANGLLLAQAGAVRLALDTAAARGPRPALLLCGGGAPALCEVLGSVDALTPDLVFEGLLIQAKIEGAVTPGHPARIA